MRWHKREKDGAHYQTDDSEMVAWVPTLESARAIFDLPHDPPDGDIHWPMKDRVPGLRTKAPHVVFRCGNAVFKRVSRRVEAYFVVSPSPRTVLPDIDPLTTVHAPVRCQYEDCVRPTMKDSVTYDSGKGEVLIDQQVFYCTWHLPAPKGCEPRGPCAFCGGPRDIGSTRYLSVRLWRDNRRVSYLTCGECKRSGSYGEPSIRKGIRPARCHRSGCSRPVRGATKQDPPRAVCLYHGKHIEVDWCYGLDRKRLPGAPVLKERR
jgi:hypothetical protein